MFISFCAEFMLSIYAQQVACSSVWLMHHFFTNSLNIGGVAYAAICLMVQKYINDTFSVFM